MPLLEMKSRRVCTQSPLLCSKLLYNTLKTTLRLFFFFFFAVDLMHLDCVCELIANHMKDLVLPVFQSRMTTGFSSSWRFLMR